MPRIMGLNLDTLVLVCLSLCELSGCDDSAGPYGSGNYPGNIVGAWCHVNGDCGSGYCCTSPACGHGMCSYTCRTDLDCPMGTRCEGGTCFLACSSDYECLQGQHCSHEHTVCQY